MARRGFVRVEVNVRKEDAGLVRGVAAALSDPLRKTEARMHLRPPKVGLKALLASASLDGIDLDRRPDQARRRRSNAVLQDVEAAFGGRVLGIDNAVSDQWGP